MTSHPSKKSKIAYELTAQEFWRLGASIIGKATTGSEDALRRFFLEFFGVNEAVCALVWHKLGINEESNEEDCKGCEPCHLLWGLLWLKDYSTEAKLCKLVATDQQAVDPKEFRARSQFIVERIADIHADVVSF